MVAGAGVAAILFAEDTSAAESRPYAVVSAAPTTMYCPKEVRFDGSGSHHGDPGRQIVEHAWDYHYDGSFEREAVGATASIMHGEVGTFTAALRVTDDGVPPQSDLTTVDVTVANRPPVADAGGPYAIDYGQRLILSAAASDDPDRPCADGIATYAWDLDDDGSYDDATGVTPKLAWGQVESLVCGGACPGAASRTIHVRVADRLGASATASATVAIAATGADLTLTWPNGGEFLGTGRTQSIRWIAAAGVTSVRVLLSEDGKVWQTIVPEASGSAGLATWIPAPSEHRVVGRGWRIKVQGFRNGELVAVDASDAPFGIGPLDLTSTEQGVELAAGSTVRLTWARHRTAARVVRTKVRFSFDGGKTWKSRRIEGNPGEFLWTVPLLSGRREGCRARVELYGAFGQLLGRDTGQGTFTILGGADLTAPESGDSLYGGASRTVLWNTHSKLAAASVRLRLTLDGGATWSDLATIAGNPGSWQWQVPALPTAATSCRLEVALLDADGGTIAADQGEGFFTVLLRGDIYATAAPASITVPAASAALDFEVAWGASSTPGVSYELQEAADPEFTAGIRTAYAGTVLSAPITGRENGSTYYYRVRALRDGWNPSGWVVGDNGCTVALDETAPGPVMDLGAAVVGDRVDLAWTNPGDADFAGVRLLRRTDSAPGAPDDGTIVYEGSGQSFADTGLAPGTYFYAVFAHDATPNFSAAALATALVEPPVAESPASILVPTSRDGSTYQVTWGASPTPGATYELEEATSPDFTANLRQAYAGNSTSAFLTGRPSDITYYYRVRAVRSGWQPSLWREGGNGCAVSWDEVPPAAVTGLLAFSHASHAHLSWVNPRDADFAGVRVVRRPDAVPENPYDGTSVYVGGGQRGTDAELVPGTQHYAVFAYDAYPNFSLAATATVQVSEPALCETCHNGDGDGDGNWDGIGYDPDGWAGPDPAAPNVMGNGIDPWRIWPDRPYADGSWGFNVNGHGRAASQARDAECTDCHDISIPVGTHLDGVLNSVEQGVNRNANTAHLRAEFLGGFAPEWDVQVTFDNTCLAARPELGGCHDEPKFRHRHSKDADPTAGAVQFGQKGTIVNGESIPYPVDSDLSTHAVTTAPDFAPCISCHNPHGTNTIDGSYPDNRMLRDERTYNLCVTCHQN